MSVVAREVRRLTAEEKASIRARLSQRIREFWATPEGQFLRAELAAAAAAYGRRLAEYARSIGLSEVYRRAAEEADLRREYRLAWGKPE